MAFPTIPTGGRVLTTNIDGTGTRTFPDLSGLTKNSGDLLIAIIVAYQSSSGAGAPGGTVFSSWGASFTEFCDQMTTNTSTMAIGAAYKWSTGSETGTFTVTQAATITGGASLILLSIPGVHPSTVPEVGTIANGTSAAANPGSLNPSGWDAEDTLWISVVCSGMTSATSTWTATGTAAPANYGSRVDTNRADDSTIGRVEGAVAFRQLNAASEDVGTAGVDVSNARNSALLIAVRPPADTPYSITTATETGAAQTLSFASAPPRYLTPVTETTLPAAIVTWKYISVTETAQVLDYELVAGNEQLTPTAETDVAQALSVMKTSALATTSEADAAQTLAFVKTLTLTATTETDQAQTLFRTQAFTPAAETDAAQAFSISKTVTLIPAGAFTGTDSLWGTAVWGEDTWESSRADEAQTLVISKVVATAAATETDVAQSIIPGTAIAATAATETDVAQTLSITGETLTPATETDVAAAAVDWALTLTFETDAAQALSFTQAGETLTAATETDAAQPLSRTGETLTPATETYELGSLEAIRLTAAAEADAAQPVTFTQVGETLTPAAETDAAQPVTFSQAGETLTSASETDVAQTLSITKTAALTPASSTEQAQLLAFSQPGGPITLVPALENDVAGSLVYWALTTATETDAAQTLSITAGLKTLVPATETYVVAGLEAIRVTAAAEADAAQSLSFTGAGETLTPAAETDTAQTLSFSQPFTPVDITPASETDASQTLIFTKTIFKTITFATETDAAQALSPGTFVFLEAQFSGTSAVTAALVQQQILGVEIAGSGTVTSQIALENNLYVAVVGAGTVSAQFVQEQDLEVEINGTSQVLPTMGLQSTGEPRRKKMMGVGL